ncbi:MAG: hypothetical protein EA400_06380 [Chromatiaceae bacterium]|nr:MAG: hypothetical protein EA400_06380 [Chromatiaceae bacterium]
MAKTALDDILARLHQAQVDLDREIERLLADGRARFRYTLEAGRVVFEQQVRRLHLAQRTRVWPYLRSAPLQFILSAPLIYGMIVPLVILDVSITLFQQLCFRIYGIPRVRRSDYLVIDRHQLAYLNGIERLNCVYCGYSNQLLEYAREVVGRTEQFWCPIKHARRTRDPHPRTTRFVDYGDAKAYRSELPRLRRDWGDDLSAPELSAARPGERRQ